MFEKKSQDNDHLEAIPGVGKSIALDLRNLGIHKVPDLVRKDPQKLYDKLCEQQNTKIDRCV
ncbi:MAG: helix-hairpin-helix domain-containing protein, partial [Bacteroidales bacterium]